MELSCSWRSRGSPCRWLRGSWDKRCGFTCWGLFSMCWSWVCWAEPSTSSILRSVLESVGWVGEFAYLTKVFLSFNNSFPGPGSISFRETTTGWSVWLLSTSPPSPSPSLIWSCHTYSVRSHRLRTTPSPCRSMLRCWGKIHGYKDKSSTNVCHLRWVSFRSIFLKLASLGIYLFFIFTPDDPSVSQEFSVWGGGLSWAALRRVIHGLLLVQCREKNLGREMYKLSIFNFLATFCNAFLFNFPRKWVQNMIKVQLWENWHTFLSGFCRNPARPPCLPGCVANSVSWSRSTSWIWCMVRRCHGWGCTTAPCCLWLELARW